MSAWIASDAHISTLVGFYAANTNSNINVKWYATRLMAANVRSVNHRYSDNDKSRWHGTENETRMYGSAGPVTVLKLAQSLDYQSCEHADWQTSQARKLLTKIEKVARAKLGPHYRNMPTDELPGYNAAPWGV